MRLLFRIIICLGIFGACMSIRADYSAPAFKQLHDKLGIAPREVIGEADYLLQLAAENKDLEQQLGALLLIARANSILGNEEAFQKTLQQGLTLAEQNNNLRYRSNFTWLSAENIAAKGHFTQALKLSDRAVSLASPTGDQRIYAEALASRGGIQLDMQQYQAALEDMLQANLLFKQNGDNENAGIVLSNIALIYLSTKDYQKAIEYFLASSEYEDKDDKYAAGINFINLGEAYLKIEQYDTAETYLKKALEIATSTGNQMVLSHTYFRLASLRIAQKRDKDAIQLMNKALPLFVLQQDTLMQFQTRLALADLYMTLHEQQTENADIALAESQLTEAQRLQEILQTPSTQLSLLETQVALYRSAQQYKKLGETQTQIIELLNITHQQEKEGKLARLKLQFHRERESEQNQLLRENNRLQAQTIKEQKLRQTLQYVAIALLVVLLGLISRDIAKHRRKSDLMSTLALVDELTGAPNRRSILERAEQEMDRAHRHKLPLTFVLIDLDYFKKINDNFGHKAGDDALIAFSGICRDALRTHDLYGRFGGEEWLIICPHTRRHETEVVIERIRERYAQARIPGIQAGHPLTFSAGISQIQSADSRLDEMIQRADSALYQAKSQGRNQTVLYNTQQSNHAN